MDNLIDTGIGFRPNGVGFLICYSQLHFGIKDFVWVLVDKGMRVTAENYLYL